MTKRFRVLLAAVAVPATGAALMLAAQGAQASTTACTRGAYEGYCGTQANNDVPGLVLDSAGQGTAANERGRGKVDNS
jgi:hypothetical protein